VRLRLVTVLLFAALATPASAAVRLHEAGGFVDPVHVAGAPGDYERLYVVERQGRVQVLRGGRKTLFADLTGPVMVGGEEGLLSVAFPPDFQRTRLLYVYFTNRDGDNEIDELRAASPDRADPGYRRRVLLLRHPVYVNHNGGQLQFGPDGYLYVGTGDGGAGYDPPGNAQNRDSRLGKILRLDPRGGMGFGVPPDNPYVGGPGDDLVWSYGLRNPFRFSFDRATRDLTIGDVGQNEVEEIDFVPAATGAGRAANFGWDECEGGRDSNPPPTGGSPCTFPSVRPVIEKLADDGWRAIIGGYVVRDPSLPSLAGRYVYGDAYLGMLHSADLRRPSSDRPLGVDVPALSSFGEDTAGCVYAASLNGPVYRLVEESTRVPCRPTDRRAPRLRVRVPGRQRMRRQRGAIAFARCDESCTVSMSGRLRTGGRSYRLRGARRAAARGQRIGLRVRLTRRASRALRRALGDGRRVRIPVALRARDRAGNRSPLLRRVVRAR
jgi:glucose/arabinose dehydrogenase